MFGRCALRLRQCVHFPRKRGVLSRRSAAGSGPLVARHRQVHAACEPETGNGPRRRIAQQAHQDRVLGHKGARGERVTAFFWINLIPILSSTADERRIQERMRRVGGLAHGWTDGGFIYPWVGEAMLGDDDQSRKAWSLSFLPCFSLPRARRMP